MTTRQSDDLTQTWIDVAIVTGALAGVAGLVDPGPFFGVWMSVAIIGIWRFRSWKGDEEGA